MRASCSAPFRARPRRFRATRVRTIFSEGGQHSPPEGTNVERVAEGTKEKGEPGTKHYEKNEDEVANNGGEFYAQLLIPPLTRPVMAKVP